MAIALALVLHAHQPVDNFDSVIEMAYQTAYLPWVEAAAARPWLKFNLHFSGFLLEWLQQHHPGYLAELRGLVDAGRLEMLGGGFYEPILAAIPPVDQQQQLERLARTLQRRLGRRPRGAWLAERVWEPELPAVLERAGVEYILLDDSHLQLAGLQADTLHGYWLTEAQGATVAVLPSNYSLRQALPFRPENEGLDYLSAAAARHPGSLLTMGDDLEKFGSWPHTFQHVYAEGWLRRFLDGLERRQNEIETVRVTDFLDAHPARGLVYIPSASYPEMMRWAGSATWRGFLTRYPEANLLHKTQQDLSRRLARCKGKSSAAARARTHVLAAECNDVYWHGWFGGVYSPHLREVAFRHLLAADQELAAVAPLPPVRRVDLLRDGSELVEMRSGDLRALVAPADGGTVIELDALAAHANLINSIARNPEAYHDELRKHAASNPANLPGGAAAPAAAVANHLAYDECPPHAARLYRGARPDTDAYTIAQLAPGILEMIGPEGQTKRLVLASDSLHCTLTVPPRQEPLALEWVVNLLAPDAPDRGILHAGLRHRLDWQGELAPGPVTLCDGWRKLHLELSAAGSSGWTIAPRYSVSQSEQGFEALYQGSAVRAHWPAGTGPIEVQIKFFPCPCHF